MPDCSDFADLMARLEGQVPTTTQPIHVEGALGTFMDYSERLDKSAIVAERALCLAALQALVAERDHYRGMFAKANECINGMKAQRDAALRDAVEAIRVAPGFQEWMKSPPHFAVDAARRAGWNEARERASAALLERCKRLEDDAKVARKAGHIEEASTIHLTANVIRLAEGLVSAIEPPQCNHPVESENSDGN